MEIKVEKLHNNLNRKNLWYDGNLDDINYNIIYKAAMNNCLEELDSIKVCLFKYSHDGKKYDLFVFAIPILENINIKILTDIIMSIIFAFETYFTEVDLLKLIKREEDKYNYLIIGKEIIEEE